MFNQFFLPGLVRLLGWDVPDFICDSACDDIDNNGLLYVRWCYFEQLELIC